MPWSQHHYFRRTVGRSHDTIPAAGGSRWWNMPWRRTQGNWAKIANMFRQHSLDQITWEDFGEIIRLHDQVDYSGSPAHFFEAILKGTDAGIAAYARLYNVTDSEPVAGSVVATLNATATRIRSPAIAGFPSSEKEYKAQLGAP